MNMHHATDIVALLFGLAFAIAGAGFLVHEATGRAVDPAWVAAIGFVALGVDRARAHARPRRTAMRRE